MTTFLAILVFAVIGVAVGFLGSLVSDKLNRVTSIILGVVGSLGISWLASLIGVGAGFMAFSLWGIVFGIVGACAVVGIYAFANRR